MMEKKKAFQYLVALSIAFALIAVIFFGLGLNKKNTYDEYGANAYVNGDAYNYIINGTYFAGYMAISGACLIVAAIMFSGVIKIACTFDGTTSGQGGNLLQRMKEEKTIARKINELKTLKEQGIISENEFEEKKKGLMGESSGE